MTPPDFSQESPGQRSGPVLALVGASIFLEALLFSVLSPVLPVIASEFGLSTVGAGAINAAYPLGLFVAAVPAGILASRIDERWGIVAALVLVSTSSLWFPFATQPWQLGASRVLAGAGSALVWAAGLAWVSSTGSRDTVATRLGTVMSLAVAGTLAGPVLGTAMTVVGRTAIFVVIALVTLALVVPTVMLPPSHSDLEHQERGLWKFARDEWHVLGVTTYGGALFSAISVLVPLTAVARGMSATVVGTAFIVGSLAQAVTGPLIGRVTDRQGPARVMSWALGATAVMCVGLALAPGQVGPVVMLAILMPVAGAIFTPTMVAVNNEARHRLMAPAIAFGVWNLVWAVGLTLGSLVGPLAADATSNEAVYVALGVVALGLALTALPRRAGSVTGAE